MTATLSEAKTATPVEFVQSLPEEQKRAVLFALLGELYAARGSLTAIPLREGVTDLGYLVRSQDMLTGYQKLMMTLPREVVEHLSVPIPDDLDLDDCVSPARLEQLHRELEAQFATRSRAAS